MTAIAHQAIRAATLRTGLGPYMSVRIDCAPPTSLRVEAFSGEMRKLRACSGVPLVIAGLEPAAGNRWRLDRDRLLDAAQIAFPQAWQFDAQLHAVQDVFRCELELVPPGLHEFPMNAPPIG